MIRSYHKVGRDFTETRIHTFGKRPDGQPLRLPLPIPMMGLVWTFFAFIVMLIVGNVLGVANLPSHPANAAAYAPVVLWHIGLPILIAYVITMAEVEGRRMHVIMRAWASQGFDKHYVGGYQPIDAAGETICYKRIRVRR